VRVQARHAAAAVAAAQTQLERARTAVLEAMLQHAGAVGGGGTTMALPGEFPGWTLRARWVVLRARWVMLRARWVDAKSSLGDAMSSLGGR
jgi:hypothetical protein